MKLFFKNELALSKRCLRSGDIRGNILAVGTLDMTLIICKIDKEKIEVINTFNFFESEVYSVKIVGDNKIVIGCKDSNIYYLTFEGDILMNLKDHSGIVNSLSFYKNFLASGSWDGTCRIWDLDTGACIKVLDNHKYAVTCHFLNSGRLLTGSQNGMLNLWSSEDYNLVKEIKAHDDIIREIKNSGENILTCSNDQTVRIWDASLDLLHDIHAHTSFIYTICPLIMSKNSFLSGGEDFKIRLYKESTMVDEINFPTAVWRIIEYLPESEYYVLGEDGVLRVFTTSEKSYNVDIHENYVQKANMASLQNPELTEEELKKYPSTDELKNIKGKKEGEIKVFINNNKPEAYMWKNSEWSLIGEVIGSNRKSKYDGDRFFPPGDYDFIFDIQDDSGSSRLLPFNKQDNPLVAAEKFLTREAMSVGYKEQIINFIKKNANLDKTKIEKKPLEEFQKQTQEQSSEQNSKKSQQMLLNNFPIIENIFFSNFNAKAFLNKLKEINEQYKLCEDKAEIVLTLTDFMNITRLAEALGNPDEMYLHDITEAEHTAVSRLLNWKDENCFFIMDFFRIYALHRDSSHLLDNFDCGVKFVVYAATCVKYKESKYLMVVLRFFCNLFKENPNAFITNKTLIFELLSLRLEDFDSKAVSLLFSLFNNYLCYFFTNNKITPLNDFYAFLRKFDLSFIIGNPKETINFIIMLGNSILFQDEIVNQDIKTNLNSLINQLTCNPPHDVLLNEIKNFVNN